MSYKPTACEMARYNKWQNENLLQVCDALSPEVLEEDRGIFFRSILATFDHILNVDQVLLQMTKSGEIPPFDPNKRTNATYEAFKTARVELDDEITRVCEGAGQHGSKMTCHARVPSWVGPAIFPAGSILPRCSTIRRTIEVRSRQNFTGWVWITAIPTCRSIH